jgi:hypothetical protein
LAVVFAAASLLAGCSGEGQRAAPVDSARARETLRIALDGWKMGETPASFKSASPPIIVQDFDWLAGSQLVGYEVTSEGKYDDANLRIPVSLSLKTKDGQQLQKRVSYVVGTNPTLTVFREMGP